MNIINRIAALFRRTPSHPAPFVRTKIIGPDLAMARAACEAGYMSNQEYIDRVAEAQADALALDLSVFTRATFHAPRKIGEQGEQLA